MPRSCFIMGEFLYVVGALERFVSSRTILTFLLC